MTRFILKLSVLSAAVLSSACSVHQLIGNQVKHFSTENVMPVILSSDDVPTVCHANETNTPLLMSFTKFGVDNSMLLAFGYSGASI